MKFKIFKSVAAVALPALLALPLRSEAQEHQSAEQNKIEHHYKFIDLGTFGGPASFVNPAGNGGPYINRHGTGVGSAATSVQSDPSIHQLFCSGLDGAIPFVFHGFEWHDGHVTDLGALPPSAENCSDALAVNRVGDIAGGSEDGILDPLVGFTEVRAVIWKDGIIKDLGTLGGKHSQATAINDRGQVIGWALNAIPDSFSGLGTEQRAFLWRDGVMRDLGDLGGPDALAVFVNDRGQIAGASLTNSTPNPVTAYPTAHPFLWENGKMIDLGSLGGTLGFPNAFNNRGQVIGTMTLPGDLIQDIFLWDRGKLTDLTAQSGGIIVTANAINDAGEVVGTECLPDGPCSAYLWRKGVTTNLGTLPGDCFSQAFVINSRDQVAGQSFSCTGFGRLFLWENGSMIGLNAFVPSSSGVQLAEALAINDHGEIAGDDLPSDCTGDPQGNDTQCGHAFVLVPCDADSNEQDCEEGNQGTTSVVKDNPVATNQTPRSASSGILTPKDIVARMHGSFRGSRKFANLPRL